MRKLHLPTALLLAALAPLAVAENQRQPWQRLQFPTAHQVASVWNNPPSAYGPEPYYGLNGHVTIQQVERDFDTMHALGFRAVTVQAGYEMPFAYLSPQYFAFFKQLVAAAKERHMCVWIVDDAGYPSGFAGGKFSSEKPQLRMQAIEISRQIPVAGGSTLHLDLPATTVSASAIGDDGTAVPLTIKNGKLNWVAPAGSWTVLIADHEFRTSPTRSDTNPHRVKDTEQSLEDYLNPAATAQFLRFTHEQYKRYVGSEFGKTILGFRGDEPDYSISGLPWTPAFFARFRQIKGYDVQPYTALLAQTPSRRHPGIPIHLTPQQLRIRADYWDVFSRMFAAGFFRPQGKWCAANHLEYQVHLNHEEREMELTHSEGSFFRDMRWVEVPGIDTIWHQIWTDTISDFPRLASSVSHVYGKPRAFTESFAAYRPRPDVTMARYILNEQFVRGVNLVEMMYFPATSSGPRPAPSFMGQPGFPALAQYVRRMSYVMAMGRPAANVALYLPSSSMWLGDTTANDMLVSTERLLSEHQIDFDIVDEDALARNLIAGHGSFRTASGNQYRTIILPAPEVISAAMLARLKAFAAGGGHVLFLGGTPQLIDGRTFRDARSATAKDFTWATVINEQLPATPIPGQFPPAAPPQPQAVPPAILQAMDAAIPAPTVTLSTPDTDLRVMKRRWRDADDYLFFNEGATALDREVTLSSHGNRAEHWDAETGHIESEPATSAAGHTRIHLRLQPYQTSLIVVQ